MTHTVVIRRRSITASEQFRFMQTFKGACLYTYSIKPYLFHFPSFLYSYVYLYVCVCVCLEIYIYIRIACYIDKHIKCEMHKLLERFYGKFLQMSTAKIRMHAHLPTTRGTCTWVRICVPRIFYNFKTTTTIATRTITIIIVIIIALKTIKYGHKKKRYKRPSNKFLKLGRCFFSGR